MFYAQFVLSKKGPMAKIWLAAHWEKKLTKAQIYETNVQEAVGEIMEPKAKMALRTTGHLLLGIVRIYSRKAKYLLADCNEAFLKIKMAFRPDQIDKMDDEELEAVKASLTLPEVMNEDAVLPDFSDYDYKLQVNQSRIDEITLKEDLITDIREPTFGDDFGIDDFGEKEFACFGDDDDFGHVPSANGSSYTISHTPFHTMNTDYTNGDLSKDEEFRGPSTVPDDDFGDFGDGGADPLLDDDLFTDSDMAIAQRFASIEAPGGSEQDDILMDPIDVTPMATTPTPSISMSMISRATDFTLDPLDPATLQNPERTVKSKRRRKLLVDEVRNITGDEMKANMADTSDTIQQLDLAPPTKKLTKLKEMGHCDQLMMNPGCSFLYSKEIRTVYHAQLVLAVCEDEEAPKESEADEFDIRKDLDMVENVDYDFPPAGEAFDDFEPSSPAPGSPVADFTETTLEEPGVEESEPAAVESSPRPESPPEKPKRKSRAEKNAEEEEEADGEEGAQRWTRRTQNVLKNIASKLKSNDDIAFNDLLTKGATAKTAAQKFYAILELKKSQAISFSQRKPFKEIRIASGANMSSFVN